jgi:hypothetical protein
LIIVGAIAWSALSSPAMADRQAVDGAPTVTGEQSTARATSHDVEAAAAEGYAAVGRRGGVAGTGEQPMATTRRSVVVAGEEGQVAVNRNGLVVGLQYEDYDAWRTASHAGAVIAVGTMLTRAPAGATAVVVGGSTYRYYENVFYTRVLSAGGVVYQVVAPPAGAIIATLPAGCTSARAGTVVYRRCGTVYYERVAGGYRVAGLR